MGIRYRFRMSELIPNAWFYKLRDMAKTRKQSINGMTAHLQKRKQQAVQPSCSPKTARCVKPSTPRKSYHFVRELEGNRSNPGLPVKPRFPVEPPRKSNYKRGFHRETAGRLSPRQVSSGGCNCRSRVWSAVRNESPPSPVEYTSSENSSEVNPFSPDLRSSPCSCRSNITNGKDEVVVSPEVELRPIITKSPAKKQSTNQPEKPKARSRTEPKPTNSPEKPKLRSRTEPKSTTSPKSQTVAGAGVFSSRTTKNKPSSPVGVRLKLNSPRVITGGRRSTSRRSVSRRRSLSESFAVVKSSANPSRDFKDSMVEMIVENNLKGSKELEDLLACYLSLNAAEHHETIIKVFRQLWVDFCVDRTSQRL